ncbi:plexin-A2-like [Babylonia areolata]|uniref:plexin-A2-like n=1 Tax=Babylonia areolata TaxID=304850 RepID=UPI003FCF97A5
MSVQSTCTMARHPRSKRSPGAFHPHPLHFSVLHSSPVRTPPSPLSLRLLLLLLPLLLLLVVFVSCEGRDSSMVKTATFHSPFPFQHLAVDERTGNVYLGAVNHLHRLTADLQLLQTVAIAPLPLDSFWCPSFRQEVCEFPTADSFNKVLLVDDSRQKLITCWSFSLGYCENRALHDISVNETFYRPIIANTSTLAFIAPGPALGKSHPNVLYVGSWTKETLDIFVDTFASRHLSNFTLSYEDSFHSTSMKLGIQSSTFPMQYTYGFGSENFSYMITVQKRNVKSADFVSKIYRVCQNDRNFYSYVEMELHCSHQGSTYQLVQAAHRQRVGKTLAERLGVSTEEDVLFAVFSQAAEGQTAKSPRPTNKSAVCMYPLWMIRQNFNRAVANCFKGVGRTGPDHLARPVRCLRSSQPNFTDDYCGQLDFNQPIAGSDPIEGEVLMTLPSAKLSAIAVWPTDQHTVVFLGTDNGTLIKVSLNDSVNNTTIEELTVAPGRAISKDLVFDHTHDHLYVLTDNDVYQVKTHDCSRHTTPVTCVHAIDPLCGWCSITYECSRKGTCPCAGAGWLSDSTLDDQCLHHLSSAANDTPTLTLQIHDVAHVEEDISQHCNYTSQVNIFNTDAQPSNSLPDWMPRLDGIQCVQTLTENDTYSWNAENGCRCFMPEAEFLARDKQEDRHCHNWTLSLWPHHRGEYHTQSKQGQQQQQKQQQRQQRQQHQQRAGQQQEEPWAACPGGMVTLDSRSLYCLASGKGTLFTPVCIARPVCRVDPTSPLIRVRPDKMEIYPGEIVTYACVEGLDPRPNHGTVERVCLINGTLTGTEIICEASERGMLWVIVTAVAVVGVLIIALLGGVITVLYRRLRKQTQASQTAAERSQAKGQMDASEGHVVQRRNRPQRNLPAPPAAEESDGIYHPYLSLIDDNAGSRESQPPYARAAVTPSEFAALQQVSPMTPEGYYTLPTNTTERVDEGIPLTVLHPSSTPQNTAGNPQSGDSTLSSLDNMYDDCEEAATGAVIPPL